MKLSIITVNYNNCEGLKKTIDSVLSQTWTDYEYIIIDGGSTDGSREVIEGVKDHLAYWCSEPDKGIYNAMNKGIDHAHGEYVIFMNSGDCFHDENVLRDVFQLQIDADIISGNAVQMGNNNLVREYNENLFWQLYYGTLNHQATFIRRNLFVDLKYDEKLKIVSDWKFWLESIIFNRASVQYVGNVIAKQEPGGISDLKVNRILMRDEKKKVLNSLFPPLILKELQNYTAIINLPIYKDLYYIKNKSNFLFVVIRKIVSFIYLILKKI